MVRVLQVIGSLNIGGSQTLMTNIYKNIDRTKIQFDFIIDRPNENFFASEIERLGGKIYILPQYKLYNHFKYKRAWNSFFKEHPEYKIVHGHVRSTASIYLKIAKEYGVITIAHSHNISSGNGIKAFIKNFFQKQIRNVADYFLGCSTEANVWLFGNKIAKSNKCSILKNGIDTNKFKYDFQMRNEIRKKLKVNDDEILIGHVGRLAEPKNHKFLIQIFSEFYKTHKQSKLLIVGNGELENKLKEQVKKLHIEENVLFIGTQNSPEFFYQAMDIFAFPSLWEGLPIVLIEAQCSGLRCLISENVTDEVDMNIGLIKKISLNDKSEWIKNLNFNNIDRKSRKRCISKKWL